MKYKDEYKKILSMDEDAVWSNSITHFEYMSKTILRNKNNNTN